MMINMLPMKDGDKKSALRIQALNSIYLDYFISLAPYGKRQTDMSRRHEFHTRI